MALGSEIAGEEYYPVAIGQGMYTSELPSNIPDGYSAVCYNMVATGDSLENRIGVKRLSFDWKVLETNPGFHGTDSDFYNYFVQISPYGGNPALPAFMWGAFGFAVPGGAANTNTLNFVRAAGTVAAGDGFMSVTVPNRVIGICQYNDTIYFSLLNDGVKKITAINWSTDTITYTSVVSSALGSIVGLFTFKDRMWGWFGNKLYFTNLPAVGGQPETWALAANVIPFVGPNGAGVIENVIPLGNKLAIFTTNGLFTLLVEGAPASWILRILDSKSICTASRCAFESKGIIYYINNQGVWATNNMSVTKLSGVIEDQFFLAKGARVHTICAYEDGMIASIAKAATDLRYYDKDNCRVLYSKLDPIAWTEWNINSNDIGLYPERFALFWSTTDKIPTYLNAEPTVYVMAFVTDSTSAVPFYSVAQLLIMDGGVDEYTNRSNIIRSQPVGIYLKTKHFDGDNAYRLKHAKQAYLEIYSSDAEHLFTSSWDIDATINTATEVRERTLNDFTVGLATNTVSIPADFRYRRAALNLRAELQSATSQIKIKAVVIKQNTGRSVVEQVG
ncbi:MAG: hypothetical protein H0V81_17640 [Solirubrobacterales bacterium]|nr:hypothetical protein [Solirubrobacterales bacterium]